MVTYYNETVSFQCGGPAPYPPTPDNVTLPDSTGTVWKADVSNVCSGCHGSCGFDQVYMRTTFEFQSPYMLAVYGDVGNNVIAVLFSEALYSDPDSTGDLVPTDFALLDTDDGRTIVGVNHTAGEDAARLTLNSPLDSSGDIGADTIFAATIASVYNATGDAMITIPVIITGDSEGPFISNHDPSSDLTGVEIDKNITFTLSDIGSGVDWTTFSIQLSGDKGYSRTYTELDIPLVLKTGAIGAFDIAIDPDNDFANEEVITVTVNVNDMIGNLMTPSV